MKGIFVIKFYKLLAGVVKLVDTQDLKSCGSNAVPVQVRSPASMHGLAFFL